MNPKLPLAIATMALGLATPALAQRYLSEVFTNAQLTITPDVTYGTNIDFLTSNFASANVPAEITELQTAVSGGTPIPAPYFTPGDPGSAVKVTNVRMDVYQPNQTIDSETARPLVIYIHTGNALPPPLNGSPNGTRKDSSAVESCNRLARRGYVAISMSYRLGWNPLAATELERRGSLLNAIYRAVHDVRQCIRTVKADASTYRVDPNKIIVLGEGTGGYISLAVATLDDIQELYIEKFRPDPFDPTVSFVNPAVVGDLNGFNGQLALYRPNDQNSDIQFCVNMGGALADTSWMSPGDAPMVAFHTVFDPFAPFTEGIVIVPTTGGPVVPVQGSNLFMELANDFGNNSSFANIVTPDAFTTRARALYGSTQTHGATNVNIRTDVEGLFPMVRPLWPAPAQEEASPWQWWDPNSAIAQTVVSAGPPPITANIASLASNPNMSPAKGRAYLDTVMGYMNPRIVCALSLGPCGTVGLNENATVAAGVEVFPNPAHDRVTFTSSNATITAYEVFDVNGRLVRAARVNTDRAEMDRQGLKAGAYTVQLHVAGGTVARKLMLD